MTEHPPPAADTQVRRGPPAAPLALPHRQLPPWPLALPLWPLALVAGLLPLLASLLAAALSMQQGLVPACNPMLDGCVSISRAARHGTPNLIFQALMVPAATLQALVWLITAHWLTRLQPGRSARLLAVLGVTAGVALVLYATFLGTEGTVYRWLRQYGTVVYFGFTCLCLLLTGRAVQRLVAGGSLALPRRLQRAMTALAVALALLGLGNSVAAPMVGDALKLRIENVTEWWGALIFVIGFCALAAMWRRVGLGFALHTGLDDASTHAPQALKEPHAPPAR